MEEVKGLDAIMLLFAVVTTVGAWFGSWFAVKSALRIHDWRLGEQKEMLIDHKERHECCDKRLTFLEATVGHKDRRAT